MKNRILIALFILLAPSISVGQKTNAVKKLNGQWKFTIGDNLDWKNPNYNDGSWEHVKVPSTWENEGFYGYDGFAWYRKEIDINWLGTSDNLYLHLGYIDDVDEVYFNGTLVGFKGYFPPHFSTAYYAKRIYHIPKSLLNPNGKNLIAVRVYDATQGGGIVSGDIGLYEHDRTKPFVVNLEGVWEFAVDINAFDSDGKRRQWDKVMVPAYIPLDQLKNRKTTYWYQRSFSMATNHADEDLVLIMGKIDDFDLTSINGVAIGSTNDKKPVGRSRSYNKTRVYNIPKGVLKFGGKNTIRVKVEDIGIEAGIYKGPIGIVPRSQLSKIF